MNTVIQVVGHVDSTGHLEVDQAVNLPAGEVWVTVEVITPEMLAAEDAMWEESIARTPDKLDQLLAEGLQAMADGTADELNPDDMLS